MGDEEDVSLRYTWRRQMNEMSSRLPGPPLTQDSAITTLLAHGVNVGIGVLEQWSARNTRLDAAWVSLLVFFFLLWFITSVGCPRK